MLNNVPSKHFSSVFLGGMPHKLSLSFGWVENFRVATSHFRLEKNGLHFCRAAKKRKLTLSSLKTLILSYTLVKLVKVRVVRPVLCHSALEAKMLPFSPNKNATYPQPIQNPEKLPGGVTIPNTYGYGNRQSASHSDNILDSCLVFSHHVYPENSVTCTETY